MFEVSLSNPIILYGTLILGDLEVAKLTFKVKVEVKINLKRSIRVIQCGNTVSCFLMNYGHIYPLLLGG